MKLKYYLMSIIGSFLILVLLVAFVKLAIWANVPEAYEVAGTIFGTFILALGVVLVGYFNAKLAPEDKFKHSFNVHVILVITMFVADVMYSEASILVIVLRNVGHLALFQLGAYIFKKLNFSKTILLK